MNSQRHILEKHYIRGRPYVKGKIVIVNPETGRQITIERHFLVDTGFDGGFHVAEAHVSEIRLIGVNPPSGTVGLAGGARRLGYYCYAFLQQIGNYEFPAPGIEAMLVLQGASKHGLLGLEILKHFIAKFDGPSEVLTLT